MTAHPRLASAGVASLGVTLALTGCATASDAASAATASYTDGEYTATAEYQAPSGAESIVVTVTLADDTITAVEVVGDATDSQAQRFQEQFAAGIASEVVGVDIDSLSVSRVAGSSLTTTGFVAAIDAIKSEALES